MENNKPKPKRNFISAISLNTSLKDLQTQSDDSNDDAVQNISESANDDLNTISTINDNIQDQPKKPKGKNNKEYIEELIKKYEANSYKSKEKVTLHTSPQIHSKLKMIAFASGVNLLDLSNAILANFLIDHKDDNDILIKKMSL